METNGEDYCDDDPYVIRRSEGVSFKPILSVENYLSLDVECIVAGSSDRTIRFLDPENLEEVAKATMDKRNVSFVAISGMSPEGDDPIIITGGKDSTIQVWDPTEGNVDRSIVVPTTEVRSISVYQGSRKLVVVGTKDGQVFVWDIVHDVQVAQFRGHMASVHCVCIALTTNELSNPEDDLNHLCIASGGADRSVRTWDIRSGKRVKKFRHQRSISSIIVTNKGLRPLLATAGVERVIKLWDLQSGILLRSLHGHLDQINSLALWEGYQMLLISGSADATIRIYDMLTGESVCVLTGHRDAVLSLTVTTVDDPKIVSSSEDLSIIQWDLKQIISDFYETSGDCIGARNDRPAYLPEIGYEAPAELDRSTLSKEDRKRIRKERKRAKRIKNLYHDWKKSSNTVDEEAKYDAENINSTEISSQDNISALTRREDPMDDSQAEQVQKTDCVIEDSAVSELSEEIKSNSLRITSQELEEDEDMIGDEELEAWFGADDEELLADEPLDQAAVDESERTNRMEQEEEDAEISPPSSPSIGSPVPMSTNRKLSLMMISGAISSAVQRIASSSTNVPVAPLTQEHQVIMRRSKSFVRGIMENVLGIKSTIAIECPPSLEIIPSVDGTLLSASAPPTVRDHHHQQANAQSSPSSVSSTGEGGRRFTVRQQQARRTVIVRTKKPPALAEALKGAEEESQISKEELKDRVEMGMDQAAPVKFPDDSVSASQTANVSIPTSPETSALAVNSNSEVESCATTAVKAEEMATASISRPSQVVTEKDLRDQAMEAKRKHLMAEEEQKLAAEQSKSKASQKLALRLKRKTGQSVEEELPVGDTELHALKAKKLEQHRLQEARRRFSMNAAKQRSASALQKRLEDIARKKMQDTGNGSRKMTDIFESADDGASDEDD